MGQLYVFLITSCKRFNSKILSCEKMKGNKKRLTIFFLNNHVGSFECIFTQMSKPLLQIFHTNTHHSPQIAKSLLLYHTNTPNILHITKKHHCNSNNTQYIHKLQNLVAIPPITQYKICPKKIFISHYTQISNILHV